MKVCLDMSWAKSLSGVTMKDSKPSASARFTRVPMMSSASKPSISSTGMWKARQSAFHVRDGGGEFLRHFIALGLVGGVFDVARGGRGSVEGDADVGGLLLFENGQQCVDESVEGGSVDAFGVADGGLDQCKVRTINQGHAIEQEKAVHVASLASRIPRVQRMSGLVTAHGFKDLHRRPSG
jgi:hypothetical protein